MRINQFIASATGLSRRAADTAIADGRVSLDGRPASLGQTINHNSLVTLDGRPVVPETSHSYILLHKPVGYISSRTHQGNDPTLYELLPPAHHRLRIAGRLDRDSSGLILLSDDGPFVHRYTHPSFGKAKIYQLTLDRPLTPAHRRQLEAGVQLTDGPSRLTVLTAAGPEITVSLSEGRNRQLRRTFGALGYGVVRLHRTAIGPYQIGSLKAGAWSPVQP